MTTTETEKVDLGSWELEFRVAHREIMQLDHETFEYIHDIELIHIVFDSDIRMDVDITKEFSNLTNLTDSELEQRQKEISKELREKLFNLNVEFATSK